MGALAWVRLATHAHEGMPFSGGALAQPNRKEKNCQCYQADEASTAHPGGNLHRAFPLEAAGPDFTLPF